MTGKRVELWVVLCSCTTCGLPLEMVRKDDGARSMAIFRKESEAKEVAEALGVPYSKCVVTYTDPRDEVVNTKKDENFGGTTKSV